MSNLMSKDAIVKANAQIYLRRNGFYGSSCDGCADTGHRIANYNELWTVWDIEDGDKILGTGLSRKEAEEIITANWRGQQ